MMKLLSHAAVVLCLLEQHFSSPLERRVLGGEVTSPNAFTFMAHLKPKGIDDGFCGGSIVTNRHILTAAHCILCLPLGNMRVVVGGHNIFEDKRSGVAQTLDVKEFKVHENFNQTTKENDIGLLVLSEKINFTLQVEAVCFQKQPRNLLNQMVTVLGWGFYDVNVNTNSAVLRSAILQVVDLSVCAAFYYRSHFDLQNPTKLCTKTVGKSVCKGDSGGPAVQRDSASGKFVQVALVSTGMPCSPGSPSVYTLIHPYINWIRENLQLPEKRNPLRMTVC